MSEYRTLDEFFPSGRGDGRKFTNLDRFKDRWIEPVFKSNACFVYEATWHCLDENGGSNPIIRDSLQMKFKEWHPPKRKITKYIWVDNKTGKIFDSMYATTDCNFHGKLTRLDWSATEFDDE